MENAPPVRVPSRIPYYHSRTHARKPFCKPMGAYSPAVCSSTYCTISSRGTTTYGVRSPKTFAKNDIVRYNTPMSAIPTTLQRMAHTKLFATFALAFFVLVALSFVILLSSLSITPSFESLESLIRGGQPSQIANTSQQTVLGDTTTTPYSNVDQKTATAVQKAQKDKPAFVMKKEEVEAFMVFATGKLDLNESDSARIIKEINAQLEHMDADYMRISLIDQKTLKQLVPSTSKNRLFFFIEGVSQLSNPKAPILAPVAQNTPLELGVIVLQ